MMKNKPSDWREKWAAAREELEQHNATLLVRQSELPEGETHIRMLSYDPPVSNWTHWIENRPYHCSGDNELLINGRLDPENCPVCAWMASEGLRLNRDTHQLRRTWLLPCSIRDRGKPRLAVLEISKTLWMGLARVCLNKRYDPLKADIIITKTLRAGTTFSDYDVDVDDDSPMMPEEEGWMEDAMANVMGLIPALDPIRFEELTGQNIEDYSNTTSTTHQQQATKPNKRTVKVEEEAEEEEEEAEEEEYYEDSEEMAEESEEEEEEEEETRPPIRTIKRMNQRSSGGSGYKLPI